MTSVDRSFSIDLGPDGLPFLTPEDIAAGYPLGCLPRTADRPRRLSASPLQVLRDVARPALRCSPCIVAFSGGRDSSLLLALLADLARRENCEPPTAVTLRYPGDPNADETSWQERMIEHLASRGLPVHWVCHDISDELDIVGPLVAPLLRLHGAPVWPPAIGETMYLARLAAGGALVTGNFGDEVLGGHRAPVLRTVVGLRGRGLTRADWLHAATALAPRLAGRTADDAHSWLREPLRSRVLRRQRTSSVRPLRWDRSVRSALAHRAVALGQATRHRIAAHHRCEIIEPLGQPDFVAAYAAFGGPLGTISRTVGTNLLSAGLLPEDVLNRRDKAFFNASRFGPATREFVHGWDGRGLDSYLVDVDALRRAWSAPVVPAGTALLLQQAWLNTESEVTPCTAGQ